MTPTEDEAKIWKEVAHRIARFFRPNPMPNYVIEMIERDVRKELEPHDTDRA